MTLNDKPPRSGRTKNVILVVLSLVALLSVVFCVLAMTTDLFTGPAPEQATLVLYDGPKPVPASTLATMQVDGNDLFVYDTAVNNTHTWKDNYQPSLSQAPVTSFDFEGAPVTLAITVNTEEDITSALVRPLSSGITPTVEGKTIRFPISEPGVYTVEYNGSAMTAMHVFANAIDHDAPTESTDTVKYIGPGAWSIDNLILKDGMEVYISGGAIIRGTILGEKVTGAKISGHGFLDGSYNDSWMLSDRTPTCP